MCEQSLDSRQTTTQGGRTEARQQNQVYKNEWPEKSPGFLLMLLVFSQHRKESCQVLKDIHSHDHCLCMGQYRIPTLFLTVLPERTIENVLVIVVLRLWGLEVSLI